MDERVDLTGMYVLNRCVGIYVGVNLLKYMLKLSLCDCDFIRS